MNNDISLKIGKKAFLTSTIILIALIVGTGILGTVVPSGSYERTSAQNGQTLLVPNSFSYTDKPAYPFWRWFTAPFEVLVAEGNTIVITIIVFLLVIAGAVSIMIKSGTLHHAIELLLTKFSSKRFFLARLLILLFMLFGSFMGIFEETVLFIPLIAGLAVSLNWDKTAGLALSLGAVGMGFSAAITNPFTIGVAQKLAGLPILTGAWYRVIIFLLIYFVYQWYVVRYLKKLEKAKSHSQFANSSMGNELTQTAAMLREAETPGTKAQNVQKRHKQALHFLFICIIVMIVMIFIAPIIPGLSDISFPLMAFIFLLGGIGTGIITRLSFKTLIQTFFKGILDVIPGVFLVLLAASIKHILVSSKILDTLLYRSAEIIKNSPPFSTALIIYGIVMALNFFISSGSAKAFLVMPIVIPLADLIGLSRNIAVLAYIFGDGFSNILYPSNALLLIALSIAGLDYKTWLRWILPLQVLILILTSLILLCGTLFSL